MKQNLLEIVRDVLLIAGAVIVVIVGVSLSRGNGQVLGSADVTHRYAVASSTRMVLSAGGTGVALASTTNQSVYPSIYNRDYFRLQTAGSGTAVYCNLNDAVPSATAYSFVLSSTTPTYEMRNGVYQGAIRCFSADGQAVSVIEYRY